MISIQLYRQAAGSATILNKTPATPHVPEHSSCPLEVQWLIIDINKKSHGSPIEGCKQANSQFKKPHMANAGLIMLHFCLLLKCVCLVAVCTAPWNSSLEGDFVPIRQTTATVIVQSSVLNNNPISPPQKIFLSFFIEEFVRVLHLPFGML